MEQFQSRFQTRNVQKLSPVGAIKCGRSIMSGSFSTDFVTLSPIRDSRFLGRTIKGASDIKKGEEKRVNRIVHRVFLKFSYVFKKAKLDRC